jgi:uncharacterized protein YqcC (DUF446 family)
MMEENFDGILKRLQYWRTRSELAEAFIRETPCDPDTTPEQANAWTAWMDFIKDNE